ncbi:GAF domain-containing protein [Hymenobacter arizonensis]|uniref:GAF domain-containing protein n=1 Tax=Hymenobacter arizonensis TaxID=1227077 RepID=A0A1I6ATQ5_HYMAR|nr:GAF domain-containing protein [Hymenobacter arizonensis]SFQ72056.1 GAF domain-containing protein [Hymenobacter arizonensis]
MISPSLPENESARLQSLVEHQLLDTLPEEVYDDITRLAAEICGTPIAAINLVASNRLWPKSIVGFPAESYPRDISFCAHTILNPGEVLLVPDARYDERFHNNPNITGDPGVVFYAGVPVQDAQGRALGSLCVCDTRPRELSDLKLESLKALAKLVNTHFQLRRTQMELEKAHDQVRAAQPILDVIAMTIGSLQAGLGELETRSQLHSLQQEATALRSVLTLSSE